MSRPRHRAPRNHRVLHTAIGVLLFTSVGPAAADDHLGQVSSNGNPNLGSSNPFCVPGAGDPKAGNLTGTPANSGGVVSCRQDGTIGTGSPR